jgi:DNA-binding transcriptional MerR regulator
VEDKDLISKKELLNLTGISYGQLYRWKRENLIPESWFNKQSSYTGQETFFPREKMLKRISLILEYKDSYSLEQLAALIHPDYSRRVFSSAEILSIEGINKKIVALFEKEKGERFFSFSEVRFMYVLSAIEIELKRAEVNIEDVVKSMLIWSKNANNMSYKLSFLKKQDVICFLLNAQEADMLYDHETQIAMSFNLDDLLEGFERKLIEITDM